MRSVVFVTDQIGYWFRIDSNGTFGYCKTTDGGATWGAGVVISSATTHLAFDVWFDQWTPGDAGTVIHCWYFDTTVDDVLYRPLDTNGDSLGTQRVVFAGATAVAGVGVFVSGTKTRSGLLYCAWDIDAGAERGLRRSTDNGASWGSTLSTTFVEASFDWCQLFPASGTGDDDDCWALYQDADVNELSLKQWDSSAASASETLIGSLFENATDLTGQFPFSASVRHSDGHLIVAFHNVRDTSAADCEVKDVAGIGSITSLTNITTNIDDNYYPSLFIDQSTDDIYVAYNGARTGSETLGTSTKVYYTKSADDGTTWSAGDTAYMEGAAAAVFQVWAPLMGPRFYVGWRVGTTLVGNAVNSVTFSTVIELVVADVSVGLSVEAPALTQANVLVAQDASVALSAESPTLQIPAIELVVADAAVTLAIESPALTQANVLAVADALIAFAAEAPSLTQANILAPNDATVSLTAENVALLQANLLAVADALIAASAESPTLVQAHVLALQDATVASSAENVTLSLSLLLEVLDAAIALTAESPTLTQEHTLAVADSTITLTADSPTLADVLFLLQVQDALVALGIESPVLVLPEGPTVYLVVGKAVDLSSTIESVAIVSRIMALNLESAIEAVEVGGRGALRASDLAPTVETQEIVASG